MFIVSENIGKIYIQKSLKKSQKKLFFTLFFGQIVLKYPYSGKNDRRALLENWGAESGTYEIGGYYYDIESDFTKYN